MLLPDWLPFELRWMHTNEHQRRAAWKSSRLYNCAMAPLSFALVSTGRNLNQASSTITAYRPLDPGEVLAQADQSRRWPWRLITSSDRL
jgi:hypothetical protein